MHFSNLYTSATILWLKMEFQLLYGLVVFIVYHTKLNMKVALLTL